MCDSLIFMDGGSIVHDGDKSSLLHRQEETGWPFEVKIAGENTDLLEEWMAIHPGWKVRSVQENGVTATFSSCEPELVARELRQLSADLPVIEFHRSERRLEEAFVDILLHKDKKPASASGPNRLPLLIRLMSTPTTPSPDFPSWFPSALVKELRQGLRTLSFILLLSLFPAALALFFLFSFIPDPTGSGTLVSSGVCNSIFWTFLIFAVAGAIPFRALFSIREELESRNSELLLLTRQTSGRIIMGKWASFMAQALLIMFICLPFAFIRYYYGQINLVQDLTAISFIYLACGILTAFCLWASALPLLLRLATMGALFLICSTSLSLFSSGLEINLFKDGFGMGAAADSRHPDGRIPGHPHPAHPGPALVRSHCGKHLRPLRQGAPPSIFPPSYSCSSSWTLLPW